MGTSQSPQGPPDKVTKITIIFKYKGNKIEECTCCPVIFHFKISKYHLMVLKIVLIPCSTVIKYEF